MKNLSLITSSLLLVGSLATADEVKTEENRTTVEGNLRVGFASDQTSSGNSETLATGGFLSITSKQYRTFKLGGTFSTTNPILNLSDTDYSAVSLLSSESKGYTILSEAYVTGTVYGKTNLLIGRKFIDTPFADTDDIGMIRNSFEVYLLQNNSIDNLTVTAGKVMKMAGVDAGTPEKFTDINGDEGANIIGLNYSLEEYGIETQGWVYNLPDAIDMLYFDLGKSLNLKLPVIGDTEVSLAGQFVVQDNGSDSNIILGGEIAFDLPSINASVFGATNITVGDLVANGGFGGGPFYTSIEQNTIGTTVDEIALAGGGEYQLNSETTLTAQGSLIALDGDKSLTEVDLIAGYQIDDSSAVDLYVSQFSTLNSSNRVKGNTNLRVFYNREF